MKQVTTVTYLSVDCTLCDAHLDIADQAGEADAASKSRLHKATVIRSLSVGQVIAVNIARTYQKDIGWCDYSEGYFKIQKLSRKEIVGRSERYSHEFIRISREDLEYGRFELRL